MFDWKDPEKEAKQADEFAAFVIAQLDAPSLASVAQEELTTAIEQAQVQQ